MRRLAWTLGITLALGGGAAAAGGPVPPCAGAPEPAPVADAGGPVAVLWHRDELPTNWQLAACGGLAVGPGAVLVGVAARLPEGARLEVLLDRLAAISTHTGIVYDDPETGTSRPLLTAATALDGPDPAARRPDFKAEEIVTGAVLHMLVDDTQAGEVVYRIDVRAAGPDAIDLRVANESTVRWMGMAVVRPGQLASLFSVTRDDTGRLVYYSLTASELAGWAAASVADATLLARALGWFRFLTAD
ncbi:MAG: DUF6675 family protein [Geminicoccaceae bacterium]